MHMHWGVDLVMSQHLQNGVLAAALADVTWRKSKHSGAYGNCVEAAVLECGEVALRNSHDPSGPALIFSHDEMAAFLAGARDGEFDNIVG